MTRFSHQTQVPRDDGCGVVVLQMLTGLGYEDVASRIQWGDRAVHYTTWTDLSAVLRGLGVSIGEPISASAWNAVQGVAIVHVEPDHFTLYDANQGLFYDPTDQHGPTTTTDLVPRSYLPVPMPLVFDAISGARTDGMN